MIKILVLTNSLGLGGGELIASRLFKGFDKNTEFEVSFAVVELDNFYEIEGGAIFLGSKRLPLFLNRIIAFYNLIRLLKREKYDLVQSHLLVSNVFNVVATFFCCHKSQIVSHGSLLSLKDRRFGWLIGRIYSRANSLVCISQGMAKDAATYFECKNISLIYNPHELSVILKNGQITHDLENVIASLPERYFLFVGRLNKIKRIADIINALQLSGVNEHLVIVGGGPEEKRLKKLVSDLSLNGKVHFLGVLANPYPLISKAIAVVLASESEGFPNVLIESLALGTPVITSNCKTGPAEILKIEEIHSVLPPDWGFRSPAGVLFNVGDIHALANILIDFKDDFDRRIMFKLVEMYDLPIVVRMYEESIRLLCTQDLH